MNVSGVFLALGGNFLWQSALVSVALWALFQTLTQNQAMVRYRIALMAFFGSLLLLFVPFTPAIIPDISFGATAKNSVAAIVHATRMRPQIQQNQVVYIGPAPQNLSTQTPKNQKNIWPSTSQILFAVWLIGSAFAMLRVIFALCSSARWIKLAKPVPMAPRPPLSRPVHVARSKHVAAPLVLGFFRPVILVPQTFTLDLSDPETGPQSRAVLEHEIAHIVRADLWVNLAQQSVLALLWWCLPLYWISQCISNEREKLCDDIAAQKVGTGRPLARALVNFANARINIPAAALAVGVAQSISPRAISLKQRVQRLNEEKPMSNISPKSTLLAMAAIPLAIAAMATITPRALAGNTDRVLTGASSSDDKDIVGNVDYAVLATHANKNAEYLFYQAVAYGDTGLVQGFLDDGVSPDFGISGDGTPLIEASRRGHLAMVKLLLAAGADVNLGLHGDGTPLIAAAHSGHADITQLLIDAGAQIDLGIHGDGNPLIGAVHGDHMHIVKHLIDKGADVNAMVQGDETPLINAAQNGRLDMVDFLVEKGADPSLGMLAHTSWTDNADFEWRTPLSEAKKHKHTAVVKRLKALGAQHNLPHNWQALKEKHQVHSQKMRAKYKQGKHEQKLRSKKAVLNRKAKELHAKLEGLDHSAEVLDKTAEQLARKIEKKYAEKYAEKYAKLYEKQYAEKYAEKYAKLYEKQYAEKYGKLQGRQFSEAYTKEFNARFDAAFNEALAEEFGEVYADDHEDELNDWKDNADD